MRASPIAHKRRTMIINMSNLSPHHPQLSFTQFQALLSKIVLSMIFWTPDRAEEMVRCEPLRGLGFIILSGHLGAAYFIPRYRSPQFIAVRMIRLFIESTSHYLRYRIPYCNDLQRVAQPFSVYFGLRLESLPIDRSRPMVSTKYSSSTP